MKFHCLLWLSTLFGDQSQIDTLSISISLLYRWNDLHEVVSTFILLYAPPPFLLLKPEEPGFKADGEVVIYMAYAFQLRPLKHLAIVAELV